MLQRGTQNYAHVAITCVSAVVKTTKALYILFGNLS